MSLSLWFKKKEINCKNDGTDVRLSLKTTLSTLLQGLLRIHSFFKDVCQEHVFSKDVKALSNPPIHNQPVVSGDKGAQKVRKLPATTFMQNMGYNSHLINLLWHLQPFYYLATQILWQSYFSVIQGTSKGAASLIKMILGVLMAMVKLMTKIFCLTSSQMSISFSRNQVKQMVLKERSCSGNSLREDPCQCLLDWCEVYMK